MGNPFSSSGASAGSSLSGIGNALNPQTKQGGSGGASTAQSSPGLMSLWNSISNQGATKGPGLYTPPGVLSQSQIATAPEQSEQMDEMQPPTWNPAWGQTSQ